MTSAGSENRAQMASQAVASAVSASAPLRPTPAQRAYLERGLNQPGGKLPLFDKMGQEVEQVIVRGCIDCGWAEPWFINPIKPDWLVCKLTQAGYAALGVQAPHSH